MRKTALRKKRKCRWTDSLDPARSCSLRCLYTFLGFGDNLNSENGRHNPAQPSMPYTLWILSSHLLVEEDVGLGRSRSQAAVQARGAKLGSNTGGSTDACCSYAGCHRLLDMASRSRIPTTNLAYWGRRVHSVSRLSSPLKQTTQPQPQSVSSHPPATLP